MIQKKNCQQCKNQALAQDPYLELNDVQTVDPDSHNMNADLQPCWDTECVSSEHQESGVRLFSMQIYTFFWCPDHYSE